MGNVFLHKRCLVLNKTWTPIGTVSLQRAIIMLFSTYSNGEPKAKVIEPDSYQSYLWDDWAAVTPSENEEVIRGAKSRYKIPDVILLTKYNHLPQPKVHFSRRALHKRDNMQCQYCSAKPGSDDLTIDHILPRSRGGTTTWENCVLACMKCNARKADRTPEEANMTLLSVPVKPKSSIFRYDTIRPSKTWDAFLGTSWAE